MSSRALSHARLAGPGLYPEREADRESGLDRAAQDTLGSLAAARRARPARLRSVIACIEEQERGLGSLGEEELLWQVGSARQQLRTGGLLPAATYRALALGREVSARRLGRRASDGQVLAAWAALQGMAVEMEATEEKPLALGLAAGVAALAGVPVHLLTSREHLAQRDRTGMASVHEALGLSTGLVTGAVSLEDCRRAYRSDIVYATPREVLFDYMRDRIHLDRHRGRIRRTVGRLAGTGARLDRLRLQGLYFALLDDPDIVLIDEARMPLMISARAEESRITELYRQALTLGERLQSGSDYRVDFEERRVELTDAGADRAAQLARPLGGLWAAPERRREFLEQALQARHLLQPGRDYVVEAGRVRRIDPGGGRAALWESGLQQMVEAKEECAVSTGAEAVSRLSYQRFFRRYLALGGIAATARESSRELWRIYRLRVVRIPAAVPDRRQELPTRFFSSLQEKWAAVVAAAGEVHRSGRPVLIWTRSTERAALLGERLTEAGLESAVLGGSGSPEEAAKLSTAGEPGHITVAPAAAGRGAEIPLGAGVADRGGLHVIAAELQEDRRIDRRLLEHCGRRGEPGSCRTFLSLEDEILGETQPGSIPALRRIDAGDRALGRRFRARQRALERAQMRARQALLQMDESLESALAFSGRRE